MISREQLSLLQGCLCQGTNFIQVGTQLFGDTTAVTSDDFEKHPIPICCSCRSRKMITDAEAGRVPVKALIWHLLFSSHSFLSLLQSFKLEGEDQYCSDE